MWPGLSGDPISIPGQTRVTRLCDVVGPSLTSLRSLTDDAGVLQQLQRELLHIRVLHNGHSAHFIRQNSHNAARLELQTEVRKYFTITEKVPTHPG